MLSLSPCCPRPDRHVGAACTLLPRLKDPRLNFDELSAEEQFFLFEAPYSSGYDRDASCPRPVPPV